MSITKRLDEISGTKEKSKSLMEALDKVEAAMNELKGNKKPAVKATKAKAAKKEEVEE
jgi:hypothetical protein